jgi:hypothetical protein
MYLVLRVVTGDTAPKITVEDIELVERDAWNVAFQCQFRVVVDLVKEYGLVTPKTEENAKIIDALLNPFYPTYEAGDFTELCKIHDALSPQEGTYFYVLTL